MKKILLMVLPMALWAALQAGPSATQALRPKPSDPKGPSLGEPTPGLAFAFCVWEESQLREALALAESIRSFGGGLSRAAVLAYILKDRVKAGAAFVDDLNKLDVEVRSFSAPPEALAFPFAAKIFAAARAEAELDGKTDFLAWLDPDTVIWQEPRAFLLEKGKSLGYRPVMHQLIGSSFDRPADAFWRRLFQMLGVGDKALFSMTTPVDRMAIRPYFNAGLLIVRPEKGLLRAWAPAFQKAAADEELLDMCRQDELKLIFLHQAALAGALLAALPKTEMTELPETYNYPLNLHDRIPAERRPSSLDGLITLRYDDSARVTGLIRKSGISGKLAEWLLAHFPASDK